MALLSFGGYGVKDVDFARLDCLDRYVVLMTHDGTFDAPVPRNLTLVSEPLLYGAGLRYEDLVAAVDIVITKPGYGIISECVANETALLYTSRGRFAEYEVPGPRDATLPPMWVHRAAASVCRTLGVGARRGPGIAGVSGAAADERRGGDREDDRRGDLDGIGARGSGLAARARGLGARVARPM